MGKDFRIGLILGLVLVIGALIWVATRPSLTPEARMRRALQARTQDREPPAHVAPPPPAVTLQTPQPRAAGPLQEVRDPAPVPPALSQESPVPPTQAPPEVHDPRPDAFPDQTIYEQDEPITTTRFHIVRRGESLSLIARQYYASSNAWRKILAANPGIKDPNRIAPGTKLIIPD